MRPGVGADGVALRINGADDLRMRRGHFADDEKRCLGALGGQGRQNGVGRARRWTVVESQHNFAGLQETGIALRRTKPRSAGGIDFDGARDAEGVAAAGFLGVSGTSEEHNGKRTDTSSHDFSHGSLEQPDPRVHPFPRMSERTAPLAGPKTTNKKLVCVTTAYAPRQLQGAGRAEHTGQALRPAALRPTRWRCPGSPSPPARSLTGKRPVPLAPTSLEAARGSLSFRWATCGAGGRSLKSMPA